MTVEKLLLRFDEVMMMLDCGRDHVYDLLAAGEISAHNPTGKPGTRGTKIVASSVREYLERRTIPTEKWVK